MSFHRENVIWQSRDKTWNCGFFRVLDRNMSSYSDEDYDPEWDVDYDYSVFEWVSTGHNDKDEAWGAWTGPNPGSWTVLNYAKDTASECADYDEMVKCFRDPVYAAKKAKKDSRKLIVDTQKSLLSKKSSHAVLREGARVVVYVDNNSLSQSASGFLVRNGDWLMLGKQRVYNVETGKLWIGQKNGMPTGIVDVFESNPRLGYSTWR